RCLDPDPDRRPRSAGEMARELELCLRPATRELVRPAPGGWREVVLRHPILTIYPPALLPHALASVFNVVYNKAEIIDHWDNAKGVFDTIIMAVNGVFFPLGMIVVAVVLWPVLRELKRVRRGEPVPPAEL